MRVRVYVRLKEGVLDVQGKAVQNSLTSHGYEGIENVRVGKIIELDVPENNFDKATQQVTELCNKLLVNPIIEDFDIKRVE
jgi:phosphoribosylformylglycinamidine synthase PurS subunit